MAETELARLPDPEWPAQVELRQEEVQTPRFTPRELRMIQEHTGRSFSQIVTDEDSDEKFVLVAWLKLRRDGYQVGWDDMDDIVIQIGGSANPTTEQPATTSPPSATTGA